MKQRITVEQLNELSEEQKSRLRELWSPETGDLIQLGSDDIGYPYERGDIVTVNHIGDWTHTNDNICFGGGDTGTGTSKDMCLPLLNIGQMIELLIKTGNLREYLHDGGVCRSGLYVDIAWDNSDKVELCDALWETVKAIL